MAKEVIIASGGCGQLFKNTSNPEVTTGDGIAAAYRAGAKVMDLEFVQFHPTTFYNPGGESFLISESLRGEGALLKNINGKRFMPSYHNQAELASRDIVARAINEEIAKTNSDYVYLDLRHLNSDYIRNRFPTIYQFLSDKSIDLTEELIPVIPAAHYTMGGIVTDLNGCSSLDSLYVCGEAACTAVHGANRLASNSLLEGLVYAHRIFLELERKKNEKTNKKVTDPNEDVLTESLEYCLALNSEKKLKKFRQEIVEEAQKIKKELQYRMTQNVGIIREERNLKFLLEWLKEKLVYLNNYLLKDKVSQYTLELKNSLQIAELIVRASLLRKESRGAHYRKDYPNLKESLNYTHQIFSSYDSEVKMNVIK
jgi:L-aspartate oxidase